jgi:hypothetical protein
MTTDELKNLLNVSATALDKGEKVFPAAVVQNIISVLQGSNNDTSIAILAAMFKMSADDLKSQLGELIEFLTTAQTLFTTDQAEKISTTCKNLTNRPIVLAIIAKFI